MKPARQVVVRNAGIWLAVAAWGAGAMTARDSAALRTTFPFDTTLCYTCERAPSRWPGFNMMRVARYDDTVFYQDPVYPAMPTCTTYADLAHHRLPLLGDEPLLVERVRIATVHFPFTVNVTETEYLSPLDSVVLYLRVLGGDSSTLHVRFDTVCSLPARVAGVFPRQERVGLEWMMLFPHPLLAPAYLSRDSTGCPGVITRKLLPQPLTYRPSNLAGLSGWPWPPDTAAEFPEDPEPVVWLERFPADSTAPLMVRHVRSDCSDSAVEYHNEGVEYYFGLSRVAGLYMRVVEIDADSVTLEYDTVSFLGGTGVRPRSAGVTMAPASAPWAQLDQGRLVVRLGRIPGVSERELELVVTDLAGRAVVRQRLSQRGTVSLALPGSGASGCYCASLRAAGGRRVVRAVRVPVAR